MAMTEDEKKAHARRIAAESLADIDFSYVVDDEELADWGATERDLRDIHDMIQRSVEVRLD